MTGPDGKVNRCGPDTRSYSELRRAEMTAVQVSQLHRDLEERMAQMLYHHLKRGDKNLHLFVGDYDDLAVTLDGEVNLKLLIHVVKNILELVQ